MKAGAFVVTHAMLRRLINCRLLLLLLLRGARLRNIRDIIIITVTGTYCVLLSASYVCLRPVIHASAYVQSFMPLPAAKLLSISLFVRPSVQGLRRGRGSDEGVRTPPQLRSSLVFHSTQYSK